MVRIKIRPSLTTSREGLRTFNIYKETIPFLGFLIICFSCGTNNNPVSDAQKEKIQGEVKEVVNTINKALEEVNWDMANESCLDSPDFVYLYNGKAHTYKEFMYLKT